MSGEFKGIQAKMAHANFLVEKYKLRLISPIYFDINTKEEKMRMYDQAISEISMIIGQLKSVTLPSGGLTAKRGEYIEDMNYFIDLKNELELLRDDHR